MAFIDPVDAQSNGEGDERKQSASAPSAAGRDAEQQRARMPKNPYPLGMHRRRNPFMTAHA